MTPYRTIATFHLIKTNHSIRLTPTTLPLMCMPTLQLASFADVDEPKSTIAMSQQQYMSLVGTLSQTSNCITTVTMCGNDLTRSLVYCVNVRWKPSSIKQLFLFTPSNYQWDTSQLISSRAGKCLH